MNRSIQESSTVVASWIPHNASVKVEVMERRTESRNTIHDAICLNNRYSRTPGTDASNDFLAVSKAADVPYDSTFRMILRIAPIVAQCIDRERMEKYFLAPVTS